MNRLPDKLIESLRGVEGFDRENFVAVHENGEQVISVRVNPAKPFYPESPATGGELHRLSGLPFESPVLWSRYGYYLSQRPSFTFDPFFHGGCYYVQEASSMFLEQALLQLTDLTKPLRALDLCAAPGGKSTHMQSLISPESLLVSNEVIRSRSHILVDNIIKWGSENVFVTNNDPSAFKKLGEYFDVIVVDAPCSGSGLFRKDEEAVEEWSLNNVQLCHQRQQRILADALPALKQNGVLIYSTCSYSKEEDEEIADWLIDEYQLETLSLDIREEWNIVESKSSEHGAKGYRFYPDKLKGEGFFISCFRKAEYTGEARSRLVKPPVASSKERELIKLWLKETDHIFIKREESFSALSSLFTDDLALINSRLNIRYAGVELGQIMKNKLVPAHALALSNLVSGSIPANDLPYEEAIRYLQRQDINANPPATGWQLVSYKGRNLGWINVLPNRINNYYPKGMRILKQS